MLTHMHMVMYTWWYWHICEGDGVWAVKRGLGSSLPPSELAKRDSGIFLAMKHLFSIAPKDEKGGEVAEVICADL
jgi:hypothetical protein